MVPSETTAAVSSITKTTDTLKKNGWSWECVVFLLTTIGSTLFSSSYHEIKIQGADETHEYYSRQLFYSEELNISSETNQNEINIHPTLRDRSNLPLTDEGALLH